MYSDVAFGRTRPQLDLPASSINDGGEQPNALEEQVITSFAKCSEKEEKVGTCYTLDVCEGVPDMIIEAIQDDSETPPLTVPVEMPQGSFTVMVAKGAQRHFSVGMWDWSIIERGEREQQFSAGRGYWYVSFLTTT
jgi:predicted alpha/beta superfamily hydrolase